jgi:hypothetical protein
VQLKKKSEVEPALDGCRRGSGEAGRHERRAQRDPGVQPKGGTVEVSSYENVVEEKAYLCIEITDTGRGIERDLLEHIFDPFFTTRRDGTGLGLSIAHQIVTRHGGFIDVKSEVGRGTVFFINMPVNPTRQLTESRARERGSTDPWLGSRSSTPAGARRPPCVRCSAAHTTSWCAPASTLRATSIS